MCYIKGMNKKILTFAVLPVVLSLSSCGYNTKDWPRVSFSFSYEDVVETSLYFHQKSNSYVEEMEDSIVSEDKSFAKRTMQTISAYPYREKKERTIDTKNYSILFSIQFTYLKDNVEEIENIKFYEYGISDGKIVLNNGEIHFIPGDVGGGYFSLVGKETKK